MTEPEILRLECSDYPDIRIVKRPNGFTIEQSTKDATGTPRWEDLGNVLPQSSTNDIPLWVFYVIDRLFSLERLIEFWKKEGVLKKGESK